MRKIYTITFHSSYNYGSNLQAYALQEYVKKLDNDCDYKIINLRKDIQKDMYKTCFERDGLKNKVKSLLLFNEKKNFGLKQERFEKFIQEYLNITKEYNNSSDFGKDLEDGKYFISGSDQVWNVRARDFDWANYLEFVKDGKRIAYSASFGPKAHTWDTEEKERLMEDIKKYDYISVREQGSYNNVEELTGIKSEINVDPTMLLKKEDWMKIIGSKPIVEGKYILLYNLNPDKEYNEIAKKVSQILNMPVVITRMNNFKELAYGFKTRFDTGPLEFLNLINNASLVLSSSFHGTVFSIVFNKPFFAINGAKDFRISTLLTKMGLENRTIEIDNIEEKASQSFDIDFSGAEKNIQEERNKSEKYLKNALDIE